jgi:hypothetical protein
MTLLEWTLTFVKQKDIIKQQFLSIEQKEHRVHALGKDGSMHDYFVLEKLDHLTPVFDAAKKSDTDPTYYIHLVCYNSKKNFQQLLTHWQQLITHQRLTMYLVNPTSKTETKWIIKPWLHHKISDSASLETGLKSLFETVEEWKE